MTPHICIRELKPISPLPIVSIIDEVNAAIRQRGYKTVALFGTRFVVESGMFGMLEGAEAIVPPQTAEIHDAYLQLIRGDVGGRSTLSRIAHELEVDAIILAGTDLSTAFDESNTGFPHIDCVKAHIGGILREIRNG